MTDLSQLTDEELNALARERGVGKYRPVSEMTDEELEAEYNKRKPQTFGGMIRGNAAEELPNVNEAGMGSLRSGIASMLGSDEDYSNALATQGYAISQDANGNTIATDPETGERAYVNQPGLDAEDVVRGAGKVGAYLPTALLTGPIKGLLRRTAATAAGAGGTDVAMQTAASAAGGDVSIDPGQTLTVAGAGAVGELGGAALARMYQAYKARGAVEDIRKAAYEMGLDLSDEQAQSVAREFVRGGGSMDDAMRANEFGIRRTQGMRTGDHGQLSREETLRQLSSGGPLRQLDQANREAIENQITRYLGQDSVEDSAQRAGESLAMQARGLRRQVKDAYDNVGVANFDASAMESLPQIMRRGLRDADFFVDPNITPVTHSALKMVTDDIAQAQARGVTSFNVKAVDQMRKKIGRLYGAAQNQTDRAALSILQRSYDDWVDDSVMSAIKSGDDEAIEALKNARSLRAEYGRKFQDPKELAKIVDGFQEMSPREIANTLGGMDTLFGKASATRIVKQYKKAGADIQPLREAFFRRAVTGTNGEILGNQALRTNLRRMASGDRASLYRELFTPQELDSLGRLSNVIDDILPKGDFARSSGTSERGLRMAEQLAKGLPFVSDWLSRLAGVGQYMGAQSAVGLPGAVAPRAVPALAGATQTTRP